MRDQRRSIAVLSDHVLLRDGVAAVLRGHGFQVTASAPLAAQRPKRPDVTLLDLDHAVIDTMLLVQQLHALLPESYLVALGTAARLGASVDGAADAELESTRADASVLLAAVRGRPAAPSSELTRMHRLWAEVTDRQRDVLRYLALGYDNPAIALELRVGPRAIKAHVSALLALFNVDTRAGLAVLARDAGLRPPGPRGRTGR